MTLVQDNSVQAINTALLSIKRDISASTTTTAGTTAGLEPGKTYNINISGNAETATTAKTARTATNANHAETATNANHAETAETATKMSNALTVNGKTYDGSEAVDAGVQKIENGGTGATTAKEAFENLANGLPEGAGPLDTEHIIFQNENRKNWGLYTLSQFWEYIKGKISSVLGLTKDNYGGKSAKSSFLDEYVGAGGTRLTSGNIVPKDASEYGGMRKDVVTSSMTDSGRPGYDGHLLTMFWDNSGRYDSQFFVSNDNSNENPLTVKARVKANGTDYGPWVDVITSNNIGSQSVARAASAGTAGSLFYAQGNEINFKGGAQTQCWFNYRNADTGGPSPVATMEYRFCNYSGDTSKSVLMAGSVKTSSKMVIPIGAPSSLEEGCIWIER